MRRWTVGIACFGLLLMASCGGSDHSFSVRPVLAHFDASPALTDPDGDHPPGLDADTGLSTRDDPEAPLYAPSAVDPMIVYHLGPAVLTAGDFQGAEARMVDEGALGAAWWVTPALTPAGADEFRRATMDLAAEPQGSPTRQLAFVLDGSVVAAPELAPDVDPSVGLDPERLLVRVATAELADTLVATLDH